MTRMRSAIAVTGLRKSFGDQLVLDNVNLDVVEGTIFALLGPNGAGKTTIPSRRAVGNGMTPKQTVPLAALALLASAATPSQAQAPAARIAGTPQLYAVQGDVSVGRPTAYVTFRTAEDLPDPRRSMVVRVSGASGRTYNADDSQRGRPRTCFRSASKPYQRTPETRRLRPGVTYSVQFFHRASRNAKRTLIHTVSLKARPFRPQQSAGAESLPRPPAARPRVCVEAGRRVPAGPRTNYRSRPGPSAGYRWAYVQ